MSKRRIVDTNLIVRHLVQDHPKHAQAASALFAACDRGEVLLVILSVVLAECAFVLESFYEHPRARIADALEHFITSPGVEIDEPAMHCDALNRYSASKAHFVDCVVAAKAVADKVPVASFDRDFKSFPDVQVSND